MLPIAVPPVTAAVKVVTKGTVPLGGATLNDVVKVGVATVTVAP